MSAERSAALQSGWTVAALYVDPEGIYSKREGVECWGEERDARLYAGPWPVVAHPPCTRWSLLGMCRGYYDGEDDGCFAAALAAVREWGGVLEHPRHTLAWKRFGLPRPPGEGWAMGLHDSGWVCEVDQRWYGHEAHKPTWLYFVGGDPPDLLWGRADKTRLRDLPGRGDGWWRSKTPPAFADVLLGMARSAGRVTFA